MIKITNKEAVEILGKIMENGTDKYSDGGSVRFSERFALRMAVVSLLKPNNDDLVIYWVKEVETLKSGIEKFLEKNYQGGSKTDREDYCQNVSCKDIWDLKELIR